MEKPLEHKRSSKWPTFCKNLLKGKKCAVCEGTKKLQGHHVIPFHIAPERELDKDNVIPLCEGSKVFNCHLFFGHIGDFKGWNENVRIDANLWNLRLKENAERVKVTRKMEKEG